jgi:hypothetical protein
VFTFLCKWERHRCRELTRLLPRNNWFSHRDISCGQVFIDSCGNVMIRGFPCRWLVSLTKGEREIWKNEHARSQAVYWKQLLEGCRQNCTSKELCVSRVVDKKSVVKFRVVESIQSVARIETVKIHWTSRTASNSPCIFPEKDLCLRRVYKIF